MIDLSEAATDDLRLLHWNAELPPAGTNDPLGLTLRVGARLSAELSHCITSITPRARYYSFFPWAFQRAVSKCGGSAHFDEVVRRVILDERALTLGAVLHHKGHPCDGGALQGSNKAETLVSDPKLSGIDLSSWKHLQGKAGGFAAYKGSLINLGLFQDEAEAVSGQDEREDIDDEEEHTSVALTSGKLSRKGEALAQSFAAAVADTKYLDLEPSQAPITFDVLNEFGAKAGLCELREADVFDLRPLRDLFFAVGIEGLENSHYRRRMTLLLVLQAVQTADANGLGLDNETFNDMTFYRRLVLPDEAKSESAVTFPTLLDDIAERWRIFHFHSYLTVALEGLLAGVARSLRGHPAGRTIGKILDDFDDVDARAALAEHFELGPTDSFQEMTPAGSVATLGIEVAPLLQGSSSAIEALRSGDMIERRLRSLLVDTGLVRGPAGPAIAAMLLFSLALRYKCTVEERYQGWNRQKVFNQQYDISLPGLLHALNAQFGDRWWRMSIRDVMAHILMRFVVRQHEAMSYERGFGGSPPLFFLEGERIVGNDISRDDVDPGNARFPSIKQVLWDLRLIVDHDSRQTLSEDGHALLASYMDRNGA